MINRLRTLVPIVIAAAALLPAAAQAHWFDPCRCQRAPLYRSYHAYHHYRYFAPRERPYVAVQLAPNVFAIPYRLRDYSYVSSFEIDRAHEAWQRRYANRPVFVDGQEVVVEDEGVRRGSGAQRVIDADAQVTILGPDRMTIRLFRKGRGTTVKPGQ